MMDSEEPPLLPSSIDLSSTDNNSEEMLKSFEESLIVKGICGGDLQVYLDNFEALRLWTSTAMEVARVELSSICFPLFAHWYILISFSSCINFI